MSGFTVIAWVKEDSGMIKDLSADAAELVKKELLNDFCVLLSCRWSMDCHIVTSKGEQYGFGSNTRITVGGQTIKNALGDLSCHIDFIRGTGSASAEELIAYRLCRRKWNVPESVSESSSGWEHQEQLPTFPSTKRRRI
ncbi:nonstructural protein 3 [Galliform chaphamaparvovirus 12]|nr:nonstructural protein 3 [Galliform chaphamaparvovirus 12]